MVNNEGVYNCSMVKIELMPDLEHCFETVAKRNHAELVQRLLGGETGDIELKEKLETLRLFLETADFGKLRSVSDEQLLHGKKVQFTIYVESNVLRYEIYVTDQPGSLPNSSS
jgi:hypothetical protein